MEILQFKKANCKNCYKCVRYCPVKAIRVHHHQAQIVESDCILCGNCISVCPQNAKEVRSDLDRARALLRSGERIIASVAPSYIANFPVSSFAAFAPVLHRLGFYEARETAEGAFLVKSEYERLVNERGQKLIISSCCPTVNSLIQKYYPQTSGYLAPVLSPMQTHAKLLKQEFPGCRVVFIGPCISKKEECVQLGSYTDLALTFEELGEWLEMENIAFPSSSGGREEEPPRRSRFFPVSGGILASMDKSEGFSYFAVDGIENCIQTLEEICAGGLADCFIEMSACTGSCVGGHASGQKRPSLLAAGNRVKSVAYSPARADFSPPSVKGIGHSFLPAPRQKSSPSENEIMQILRRMGKLRPEDELNCGACGYATCRDKAAAVFLGRAEISMCLPFMKERAESFSDKILSITPNAIITVDSQLIIQQINEAACRAFSLSSPQEAVGKAVSSILDEFEFVSFLTSGQTMRKKTCYLDKYGMYAEETYLFDEKSSMIVCLLRDITEETKRRLKTAEKKEAAACLADKIVEKQLRIVHEIASLLGETAAETEIALTDLKNIVTLEQTDSSLSSSPQENLGEQGTLGGKS